MKNKKGGCQVSRFFGLVEGVGIVMTGAGYAVRRTAGAAAKPPP